MKRKRNTSLKFLLMALTACCLGCSGASNVDLGTVTGVITMDGEPLVDSVVIFVPEKGNPSTARTDENGKYELTYLGNAKGAIVGTHKVSITTGEPLDELEEIDGETDLANLDLANTTEVATPPPESDGDTTQKDLSTASNKKRKKEIIPAKYNKETTLTAAVKSGENTFDFKLESK